MADHSKGPGTGALDDDRDGHHELRRYRVGISVEQLALGWLRTEGAPSGSVVLVEQEIVPRQRLGVPWPVPAAATFSCAAIVRCAIALEDEPILWVAALVAAGRVLASAESGHAASIDTALVWPDSVVTTTGSVVGSVNIETQRGPGTVQAAIVSLRLDTREFPVAESDRAQTAKLFAVALASAVASLAEERDALLDEFTRRSALQGSRVRVRLLPRGDTRGTFASVTSDGRARLESSTGMSELLDPSVVLRIERVE